MRELAAELDELLPEDAHQTIARRPGRTTLAYRQVVRGFMFMYISQCLALKTGTPINPRKNQVPVQTLRDQVFPPMNVLADEFESAEDLKRVIKASSMVRAFLGRLGGFCFLLHRFQSC